MRTDTVKLLEKVSENNKIMVDVGNAYALPYVTDVADIAMDNSGLYFAEESVPFMQIVTHGYVSYTGEALNLSDNYDMLILKSVEYGAGIRYIMNYAKPKWSKTPTTPTFIPQAMKDGLIPRFRTINAFLRLSTELKAASSPAMSVCPTEFMSQHTKTAERLPLTTAAAMFRLTV